MRIGNLGGRAVLVREGLSLDIHTASGGRFGPEPLSVYEDWDNFEKWGREADFALAVPYSEDGLDAPVPNPGQVFAIGLNYRDHADEAGLSYPEHLVVFTKFNSSLAGPRATVELPSDKVDYETELVVVIGRGGFRVAEANAWELVAGLAVGQDLSEREVQRRGPAPQFSLGKSYPNFAPFGPTVVTLDEIDNPNAMPISAKLTGPTAAGKPGASWKVQDGTSEDLIFSIPRIISDLSHVVRLGPGDIIFTGTPAGVGMAHGIFLQPGDTLVSEIGNLGQLSNNFVTPSTA